MSEFLEKAKGALSQVADPSYYVGCDYEIEIVPGKVAIIGMKVPKRAKCGEIVYAVIKKKGNSIRATLLTGGLPKDKIRNIRVEEDKVIVRFQQSIGYEYDKEIEF